MEIKLKEKRVISQDNEFSHCLILYSANGISMFQHATLNNKLPDSILLQMCETWAKKHSK